MGVWEKWTIEFHCPSELQEGEAHEHMLEDMVSEIEAELGAAIDAANELLPDTKGLEVKCRDFF